MKGFWRSPISAFLLFSILAWALTACGGGDSTSTASNAQQGNCANGSITTSGSSTLSRSVQTVVDKYEAKCPSASITVSFTNNKAGLTNVEAGKVDIGTSDTFADKTQTDLVDHQVAVASFGILINAKANVKNLTTAQVKDIYTGKATNWKQVGGPDMKIVLTDHPAGSGARTTFEQYILGGPEAVTVLPSLTNDRNGTIINYVAQNEGAIGYGSPESYENNTNVVAATIDGNAPTPDLVKNNTYKFWTIEHMYTK